MPKKGYKQTKEHKEKFLGRIPWNKGLTKKTSEEVRRIGKATSRGKKGVMFSEKHKANISKGHKGFKHSKETKLKIGIGNKGKKVSLEVKLILREKALIQFKNGVTEETRLKISKALKGKNLGEKSSQWKGGISKLPYGFEFNKKLKQKIKNNFHFKCVICNITEKEFKEKEKLKRGLSIHHIDYDKQNNSERNLICICSNCHTKTNFYRKYWKKYFTGLLIKCKKL